MLGVTAERFPKGGAFLLGLMGCVGNLAIALILPLMGQIYDNGTLDGACRPDTQAVVESPTVSSTRTSSRRSARPSLRCRSRRRPAEPSKRSAESAILPIVLVLIFGSIAIFGPAPRRL